MQTVLINSVYGTSTDDDWSSIYSMAGDGLDSSYISENGAVTSAAQTGDPTPIGWYLALFGISGGCPGSSSLLQKEQKIQIKEIQKGLTNNPFWITIKKVKRYKFI